MAKKMALPKIGVNMTEAVIAKWLVKEGDEIKDGDAIIEAETDKSTQEIYATESGIVAKLLFEEGQTAQCFDDIMVLVEKGEAYIEQNDTIKTKEVPKEAKKLVPPKVVIEQAVLNSSIRVIASPLAKKIAKEMGIDIAKVPTSGRRIIKDEVLAYAKISKKESVEQHFAQNENMDVIPMSATRKIIAARMSESNIQKPCAALTLTANAHEILALRAMYKARDINLSIDAIFAKVVAKALMIHRNINTVLEGENILVKRDINIGIAVDTKKGLTVPVIKNADIKSLTEITNLLADLADEAKNARLNEDSMTGGTFTVTNLGMFGVEQFTPVINPPECCILALGAIKKTFVPDEFDNPILAKTMQITLVFDHRIVDGAPAAKFLKTIKDFVECPQLLI